MNKVFLYSLIIFEILELTSSMNMKINYPKPELYLISERHMKSLNASLRNRDMISRLRGDRLSAHTVDPMASERNTRPSQADPRSRSQAEPRSRSQAEPRRCKSQAEPRSRSQTDPRSRVKFDVGLEQDEIDQMLILTSLGTITK